MADSDEEFYDCLSDVKYCAIASPQGKGYGEVFLDMNKAREKWKQVKGARMKVFDDYSCAQTFADSPVTVPINPTVYPPSPKADVESTPYSSVTQVALLKFRALIEKNEVNDMRQMVDENPMMLVTSSDTPTLIQVRLRYNALHVAAAAGVADAVDFILSRLNSAAFWKQIYPGTDDHTATERQKHVLDLYLNSPELGNLETPLHFACKFGHLNCARLLICHPLTQLDLLNRTGQRPIELACSRVSSQTQGPHPTSSKITVLTQSIRRLFDQSFVILADVKSHALADSKITILPPCDLQRIQLLLAHRCSRPYPGLFSVLPYLPVALIFHQLFGPKSDLLDNPPRLMDLTDLGLPDAMRSLVRIRAIAGPMQHSEAESFRSKWLKANVTAKHRSFASIRLTDPEKGYERQGRYFSKLFGTQWFEYWDFLDDFVDLSSERGLEMLEQYLNTDNPVLQLPSVAACNGSKNLSMHHSRRSKTPLSSGSQASADPTGAIPPLPQLNDAGTTPTTPVARARRISDLIESPVVDPWRSHRSHSQNRDLLSDSLEESSENSDVQTSCHELDSTPGTTDAVVTNPNTSSPLSPIVNMLEKLTFRSPLRWLLIDRPGFGEPLFRVQDPRTHHLSQPISSASATNITADTKKPGPKRRISAVNSGDLLPNTTEPEQPAAKKRSPVKHLTDKVQTLSKVALPALFRHVCRALPGGDPELETAVAVMAYVGKETKASDGSSSNADSVAPRWFRSTSLSKFHSVSNWKRHVEECDTHVSHSTI